MSAVEPISKPAKLVAHERVRAWLQANREEWSRRTELAAASVRVRGVETPLVFFSGSREMEATLAQSDVQSGYVLARVSAIHAFACPATRLGAKFGPCTCGAEEMFDRLTLPEEGAR